VIEMIEIGAGGGSIARIDALGLLAVGPESAGAVPGPACYGRGGLRATVTDADLLLGYLGADSFLGGDLRLDVEAAREAVETMARALGLTPVDAAWGIHAVVDESMANAARVHAIERGLDASGLPLFAFGGAGPVHACHVARALRSPCVIVPQGAGVLSASGFLEAPLAFDFVRSYRGALAELDWTRVRELLGEMEQQGAEILAHAGVPPGQVLHRRSVEARYVGQGYEIPVELPAGPLDESAVGPIESAFVAAYRSHYGRPGPAVPVEIVTWRVVSSAARAPREAAPEHARAGEPVRTSRAAYFPEAGGFVETPVIARSGLGPGTVGEGPAIVEERESTLVVPPGARWSVGGHGEITVVLES
jgi:N-methylhydantoinase A